MWKDCYFLLYAFSFASGAKNEVIQYPSTTVTPLATSRDDTKSGCTFDPCMFLYEYCLNGGQCLINQSTCDATCVCVEGYSGYRCQNELNTRNENGENSSSGLTTVTSILGCSGEVCVHGRCVSAPLGTTRCRCDAGWFGANCGTAGAVVDDDILKQLSKISSSVSLGINDVELLSDDTDQKESLNDDAGQMDNKQQMQNIHINNNLFIEMDNKQNNSFEVNETDAVLESAFDQRYNICSENPIERNEEEKRCKTSGDLKCVYGVCEETLTDHGTWKGYTTVCKCDPGARGILCEHRCCLDCGENGKCDIHEDGDNITEHCNCRHRYTGLFCEIYVPNPVDVQVKEDTWYLWIVGVCVGTFIILVTMAILGPYFMWKHRVIVVMKIVHYFQAYEDDDDKEWDAFVSYKSHHIDEQFVVQVLYPKLEKELGFKLCLHFRDFVPGETISNNIINAVEGSRRTILILTPRYVESEFTRFEYQKAQTEMLKRKHRIIPIMLEDISGVTNMDKNLKGIISSVTYLEWPKSEEKEKKEDKFWKRLQLSLPKKKVSDFDQKTALTSVGSSFYSSSKDTSVSSGIDSWFGSSLMSSEDDFSTKSSTLRDSFDENIYSEIGAIDESLRVKTMSQNATPGDFSETVKPLSEEEEQGLMYSEANQVQDGREQTDDYIDMEHDRYIEFSLEDNPPSASLTRKKLNTNIILQSDGYIEVDV